MIDLKGKVGLVVGISNDKSIAYGCAEKFKSQGAELVITYLNEKAEPFVRPLAQKLTSKLILPCDVRNDDEMEKVFIEINKIYGKLDFVLHSIAYSPKEDLQGRVTDCSRDGFLESLDISCYSLISLSKFSEPLMKKGGSILTISYYGGEKVIKNYNIMGVAKAALESTTRYLAFDLGKSNIRVNALSPGPINTRAASGIHDFDEILKEAEMKSPLHRLIDTESVGNMAAFLVSDESKNITGTVHFVDAGYSIIG
jgi:enoyl-[acyl-carrier protein] reductase I